MELFIVTAMITNTALAVLAAASRIGKPSTPITSERFTAALVVQALYVVGLVYLYTH